MGRVCFIGLFVVFKINIYLTSGKRNTEGRRRRLNLKEAQTEAQTYEGTLYLDARHYPTAPVNLWQRAPFARAARHARGFAPWFPKRAT